MRPRLASFVCGSVLVMGMAALAQTPAARPPAAAPNAAAAPKAAPKAGAAPAAATGTAAAAAPKSNAVDPATLQNLPAASLYRPPEGISTNVANFNSENVRLTALWVWATPNYGKKMPTVIMAPGWGATAATLRQDAVDLAKAGYLVMLFDYRGWGDSDGRMMKTGTRASGSYITTFELRGYFDPQEQDEDWFNAVSYAVTFPMVDENRIGLRGSGEAGGYVIDVAAHDRRVRALVSQVGNLDMRPDTPTQPGLAKASIDANAAASRIATGADYPFGKAGIHVGPPIGNKTVRWAPIEEASWVVAPSLFIVAGKEDQFSNTKNGTAACEQVGGPRKMIIFPSTHYDIYGLERERAIKASIDWFNQYLKPASGPAPVPAARAKPVPGSCNAEPEPEIEGIGSGGAPEASTKDGPSSGGGFGPPGPQDASGRWN